MPMILMPLLRLQKEYRRLLANQPTLKLIRYAAVKVTHHQKFLRFERLDLHKTKVRTFGNNLRKNYPGAIRHNIRLSYSNTGLDLT
jgi:hypothetical protein